MNKTIRQLMDNIFSSDLVIWFYLRLRNRQNRILLYHGVSDLDHELVSSQVISGSAFREQIDYLKKHYVNVPLDQAVKARQEGLTLPQNGITITFDDGYENNYLYAAPILLISGFNATIFVCPKYVEMAQRGERVILWWDIIDYLIRDNNYREFIEIFKANGVSIPFNMDLALAKSRITEIMKALPAGDSDNITKILSQKYENEIRMIKFPSIMNWDQIITIDRQGIRIGAHTMSHVAASVIPKDRYEEEITRPKEIIEQKLGRKIDAFAFPYGSIEFYSNDALQVIKRAGYHCALLVLGNDPLPEDDPVCFDRIAIAKTDDMKMFKIKAAGIYDDIKAIIKRIRK